jgi:hypothetical protein
MIAPENPENPKASSVHYGWIIVGGALCFVASLMVPRIGTASRPKHRPERATATA